MTTSEPSSEPKSTPDRRELVEWLVTHEYVDIVLVADETDEVSVNVNKFVGCRFTYQEIAERLAKNDAYMQKHFPDTKIVELMNERQAVLKEERSGL